MGHKYPGLNRVHFREHEALLVGARHYSYNRSRGCWEIGKNNILDYPTVSPHIPNDMQVISKIVGIPADPIRTHSIADGSSYIAIVCVPSIQLYSQTHELLLSGSRVTHNTTTIYTQTVSLRQSEKIQKGDAGCNFQPADPVSSFINGNIS